MLPGCETKLTLLQEWVPAALFKVNGFHVFLLYKGVHIHLFVDTKVEHSTEIFG